MFNLFERSQELYLGLDKINADQSLDHYQNESINSPFKFEFL